MNLSLYIEAKIAKDFALWNWPVEPGLQFGDDFRDSLYAKPCIGTMEFLNSYHVVQQRRTHHFVRNRAWIIVTSAHYSNLTRAIYLAFTSQSMWDRVPTIYTHICMYVYIYIYIHIFCGLCWTREHNNANVRTSSSPLATHLATKCVIHAFILKFYDTDPPYSRSRS